jgi:hypothetical protein
VPTAQMRKIGFSEEGKRGVHTMARESGYRPYFASALSRRVSK